MRIYTDYFVPWCLDLTLSQPEILELRERVVRGLAGRVLEVGFGSGLNLRYYPEDVTQVLAVDPGRRAQRRAQARIAARGIPVQWLEVPESGQLPLPDGSVDAALSTFTLCTIPQVDATLRELKRVLKPHGKLHFLEHGRSPRRLVARLQDRLTPVQRCLVAGCHLNRPIDVLLRDAGFCLNELQNYDLAGRHALAHMFEGVACNCGQARDEARDLN